MSELENETGAEQLTALVGSLTTPQSLQPIKPVNAGATEEEAVQVEKPKKSGKPVRKFDGDEVVFLSALKVHALEGNSTSVKKVQLRLRDLGFDTVVNDKFGRLEDGSVEAIKAFSNSVGLSECGCFCEDVIVALFDGLDVGVQD